MTTDAWLIHRLDPMTTHSETDFDTLFLTHYDGVYRLLYRIVSTREEAEDLAQETFLRLSRQRFAAGQEHNVRAWLYRVATNLAYNALRGEARRTRRQERSAVRDVPTTDLDPTEVVVRGEDRIAVQRALASLPEQQSRLLLLRHAGLSYRELAEAVGVAPGSVGTLLARAETAFERAYSCKQPAQIPEEGVRR
jgi:RNA polymerase sigma-70 factor (ECF subfamily)